MINIIHLENDNTDLQQISERNIINYNENEIEDIEIMTGITSQYIIRNIKNKKNIIYKNQIKCAKEIIDAFKNQKIMNVFVHAHTQCGKTGTAVSVIDQYLKYTEYDKDLLIPPDNIYVISGLSSNEWKDQTKERFPENLRDNIYHRDKLTTEFLKKILNKKNILIILDEIQLAAKNNQTLNKVFKEAGFYSLEKLYKYDIKIINFSATPNGVLNDILDWEENSKIIKLSPGEGYKGCIDLLEEKRVFQYKNLEKIENVKEIKQKIIDHFINSEETNEAVEQWGPDFEELKNEYNKCINPKYHIIRTPNANKQDIVIYNLNTVFDNPYIIKYDRENKKDKNINDYLKDKPEEHTFILLKEMMRCSKTWATKTYIGVVYERWTKSTTKDDSVIIQGLLGRCTGYNCNNSNYIIFTHIKSIESYKELINTNFMTDVWRSKTNNKKLTFHSPEHRNDYLDLNHKSETKSNQIKIFDTYEKYKLFVKKNGWYCRKEREETNKTKKINGKNFFEQFWQNKWAIRTVDDIKKKIKDTVTFEKYSYRLFYCYENLNNNLHRYAVVYDKNKSKKKCTSV